MPFLLSAVAYLMECPCTGCNHNGILNVLWNVWPPVNNVLDIVLDAVANGILRT